MKKYVIFILLPVFLFAGNYSFEGNLQRIHFNQVQINPADTLGHWYRSLSDDWYSSSSYWGGMHSNYADYLINASYED